MAQTFLRRNQPPLELIMNVPTKIIIFILRMHFADFHFKCDFFEVFVSYFLQLFQPSEDPVILFLNGTHFTEH